ncbi:putative coiled-coil domain-containing protein 178 isoform 4 [Scophthalmus maximus]|uniref:Putative coiled-coil domain-containing protein 178 isoform 4 n=1 Tax=Scophthalmus maximus TaxID=52904 RepID=A0A2U9BIT5_SCOMX|nr:putative coiled-coil domain-containing protein 178 isoform 4 [Scophthalmus maximus]
MILLSFISEKLQQLCQTSNLSDTRQEKDDRVNQISQVAAQKSPFGSLRRVLKTGCTDQLIQVVEGDFIPKKAVGSFSSFVHLPQDQADLQVVCSGRRRTCALLNSPSPCVNKAIHHMQELKMTVENWCQQSGKYQPPADQNKHQYSKTSRFQPRHSDTESVTSTELFVEGVAISTRGNCPLSPLLKKINDVLREVVCLIERLEADRQFADEALHKEKRRKRFLENKVNSISLWKQQEHSFVVKKEHEACNREISGLKWQLKLEKEKLDQAQGKLSNAEVLNLHLQEDINFAKKQIPIVKENLGLQRTIIDRINTAQAEADEVHAKTQSDLLMVQKELKKMQLDANNEKIALDHELLAKKNQLANRVEELNQLTMLEKSICAEINVAEKTIAVTEEKCADIRQRIPEMIELEKTEKDQILHLKLQIEDKMQKNKKLRGKVIALQEDVERSKLNGEAEVSCLEEQLHSKSNAFAALRKENMEYEQNVEDYKTRISDSEKAVRQMRKERKQMLQKITDNDEQWEKAKKEVTQVVARHSVTQTKLDEQEQLTFMEEQRARKEMENLRSNLTGQITVLELLKAQCADTEEGLKRQKRSSELTNRKLHKDFEDAYSATQALQMKVEKTKKVMANLEQIQCDHRNALHNLEREIKVRGDRLRAAQDLHAATIKRYDNALGRISDLRKKSKEYQDASDKMEEIVESMPEVIEELQSVFDAVAFKNKSAALIMSTLQSDINNCQRQTQRSMQTHTAHVTARRKKMEETKEALEIALTENKQLAIEYKRLKKSLMEARQEAVSALSKKNQEHTSFHYYTQVVGGETFYHCITILPLVKDRRQTQVKTRQ